MPTLNEGIKIINKLSNEKGWNRDVSTKIYYAMLELGEAGNAWKHRENADILMKDFGIAIKELPNYMATEFIDVFQFLFDAFHCLGIEDVDSIFDDKVKIIENRNRIYPDNRRSSNKSETEK